ncbi:MAG: GTPase ObgE [Lachnospiraceae bacterium]|nr:GTPase ObgE [Lachnospiraceae bacterium]
MFADRAKVLLCSGKGGDGHVSFRREKYVPDGGPDGGDGGKGGDVIIVVDKSMNTLSDYRHCHKFSAQNGEEGGKKNCHGKKGQDLILKVPEGTIIREAESGKVIMDMSGDTSRYTILTGGQGGLGNQHFATSTMQAPKYAKPGGKSRQIEVILELKVIADVGLIGFPNVGKSTFLSRVTNAQPKIANYHFTTLNPILGVVNYPNVPEFVIADIPGLIEGAADGIGLGHEFLRHIQRTKVLVHLVDGASVEGRDPVDDIKAINAELAKYDGDLLSKPQIIALNKMDVTPDEKEALVKKVKEAFSEEKYPVYAISAVTGEGLKELLFAINETLEKFPRETKIYESEVDPDHADLSEGTLAVYRKPDGTFIVEGTKIDKMLGYTNLDSEKGFVFFQKFLRDQGINKMLKDQGIEEGDTVWVGDLAFEYYDS